MNFVLYTLFLLFFLFNIKSEAQVISENQDIGHLTGKNLGTTGQLLKHIQKIKYPLRIGLMQWHTNQPTKELSALETLWKSQLSAHHQTQLRFQNIVTPSNKEVREPLTYPYARTFWIQLCHQYKIDLFIQSSLQKTNNGYWLNIQLIYGINGKTIKNKQLFLNSIDINRITKETLAIFEPDPYAILEHTIDIGTDSDPGEVHIETIPENMYVELNGFRLGQSPLVLRHLPPGQHQLALKEIHPFRYQRLRISSNPPGVEVYLNEQFQGLTPLSLPSSWLQTAGTYQLAFKGLTAFKADLEIVTQPEGVPFSLDDNTLRKSPVTFQQLNSPKYKLLVKENETTSVTQVIQIAPHPGPPLLVNIEPYKYAKIVLEASEENTTVILDQENRGETPLSINLTPGIHHLQILKPRFQQIAQTLNLSAGETSNLFFKLEPKSIDTSIFLNPTGEISNHINISTKVFGFSTLKSSRDGTSQGAGLASIELDYGWPQIGKFYNIFDLGLSVSGYTAILQKSNQWINYKGLGGKLQLFKESQSIPVSVAIGSYINLDLPHIKPVGFISFSRNFFDFALHLGLQTHGMNLNIGYNGFDNLRLGLVIFANSFFGLLTSEGEELSTLYGLQAGYKF